MDTSTLFSVAPTFPLDDTRIRERSRGKILGSPVTWGSLVGATVAGVALGAGFAGFLALYALTAFGLRAFWGKRKAAVDVASMRELIGMSNAAQDAELSRIIARLQASGHPQYALCLGRFLFLKRKIEGTVHRGTPFTAFAPEIEKGVDGICAEVCREITRVRARDQELGDALTSRDPASLERLEAARRDSHAAILHAYTSLYQIHAELLGLESSPAGAKEPEPEGAGRHLQRIVGELREETAVLSRAQARIRESLEEEGYGGSEGSGSMRSMESA